MNITAQRKKKRSFRDFSPRAIVQSFFLTAVFFIENNLTSHAAACAFGFLFSFIPILMMIAAVLVHFLHASADSLAAIFGADGVFQAALGESEILSRLSTIRGTRQFEIVAGGFTVWMARNFFNSVSSSLRQIYKTRSVSRPVMNQIIVFAEELLVVSTSAALIFATTTAQTIFSIPLPPEIATKISDIVAKIAQTLSYPLTPILWLKKPAAKAAIFLAPYVYICFFTLAMYKSAGGSSRPSLRLAFCSSALCTAVFAAVQRAMSIFINVNRYNLVYGVFSRFIVMLLGVYVFFVLFLFFAEFMFVIQFFDDLLLGELYLLQNRDLTSFFHSLRYRIFVLPDYFLRPRKKISARIFSAGETVYRAGDEPKAAFYIAEGSAESEGNGGKSILSRGSFFGEMSCVLKKPRDNTVIAREHTVAVEIGAEEFSALIQKNSEASFRLLEQIGAYFSRIYSEK